MRSDDTERDDFILKVALHHKEILLLLWLLGQLAVAAVLAMEAFGTPRWAAITGLLMFPVVSWLVVRSINREQEITSLTLARKDNPDSAPGSPQTDR